MGLRAGKPAARPALRWRLLGWVLWAALTGGTAATLGALGVYVKYVPTLPAFDTLEDYQPPIGTRIYSADNQLIGEFAAERRVLVPYERLPRRLLQAFISAEDKRFHEHGGIDLLGVTQAVVDKLLNPSSKLRGASTITQQVAKSLLATHESYEEATRRSLERKLREALLAMRLEASLSKPEILTIYANQIFLGHKAYGVQAAAEHYFRKNVWELTLAEMATLAGLPQRPSDYSPYTNPNAARRRRAYVLGRMMEDGHITQAEFDSSLKENLKVYPRRELYLQIAPYFTEEVRRQLVATYGERAVLEEGLSVYTTMNMTHQMAAQAAVADGLIALDRRQGYRRPLAHLDKEQRPLFRELQRKHYGLDGTHALRFEENATYAALVTGFATNGKQVALEIAGSNAVLPLAGMRWARKPNPTARVDANYVTDARRVFEVGDVIAVRQTTRDALRRDVHSGNLADAIADDAGPLFALQQEPLAQAAIMAVEPATGYVTAQVGGYNFEDSSFNRATQACREPGSAFKPVVYSAAIDKLDYTASTLIDDKPLVFDDAANAIRWKPDNAEEEFRGELPMRTCLMDSINVPAIRIAEAVGIGDVIRNAQNLGMTTPLKEELGTALGSSCTTLQDLMRVYTTLNQYGERRELRMIRKVVDRGGIVLFDVTDPSDPALDLASRMDRAYEKVAARRARGLGKQSAFLTVSLMQNVIRGGTGAGATRLGVQLAGKTGTTNDSFDAWFMAFTPKFLTGVWIGHDKKERPLGVNEQGARTALPIWRQFMEETLLDHSTTPPKRIDHGEFAPPEGVVRSFIDPETGLLARADQRGVVEWYRAGSQPSEYTPDAAVLNPDSVGIFDADTGLNLDDDSL